MTLVPLKTYKMSRKRVALNVLTLRPRGQQKKKKRRRHKDDLHDEDVK